MLQSIYSRSATILRRFTSNSLNQVNVLYEPGFTSPWDLLPTTRYCGFITDLRMMVRIQSIDEQQLPELEVTATRTERITAVRDMEWGGKRKELALFIETSAMPPCQIASIALLNRVPYYHVNLMPYFTDNGIINVAADARILASIKDAGYGLLQGTDEVTIFGSVKEEVTTLPEEPRIIQYCQPHTWTVGTGSIQLLPVNENRLQSTFVNRHNAARIYLNYGALAEVGKGICLMPNGGSYEINKTNPYQGVISAIADTAGATLSGLECV
jgi:hypothetical protein